MARGFSQDAVLEPMFSSMMHSYKASDNSTICFSAADYEDKIDGYTTEFGDRMACIEAAKSLYDWALLAGMLAGESSLSAAKVHSYDEHKSDLSLLKSAIRKHCSREQYDEMFRNEECAANYIAYIGKSKAVKNSSVCTKEDFYKSIKSLFASESEDTDIRPNSG